MASYTLHIQYVDRPAEIKTFSQPRVSVGREGADISLFDSQVSGQHGEFVLADTGLQYVDVGSTNGSFTLQGNRIAKLDMTAGTSVRLGNSVITLKTLDIGRVPRKGGTVIAGEGMPIPSLGGAAGPPGDMAYAETGYMPQIDPASLAGGAGVAPPTPPVGMGAPEHMETMPVGQAAFAPGTPGHVPAPGPGVPVGGTLPGNTDQPQPGALQPAAPSISEQLGQVDSVLSQQGIGSDNLKGAFGDAWRLHQAELVPAAMIIGGVTIPAALLGIVFGLIPVVGPILGGLLALVAGLALGFVCVPAATQLLMNRHLGQPVAWLPTINAQIPNLKVLVPSFLVAGLLAGIGAIFLVVPAIILGCFIGPIYFAEDKRIVDITKRNVELALKEPVPLIVKFVVPALALGLVFYLATLIFGWIWAPLIGLVVAVLEAIALPFMMSLSITQYFQVRQKHEGGDPLAEARPRLVLDRPQVAVTATTPS
ncbi:MAG: FHA domain-containing protein [Myxococcales bacterium]|nr:FHA domain-containing protein [Myxococcales bacterium]MCB9749669.1 FHA domain-containing protein [Myxococcales bacterium]